MNRNYPSGNFAFRAIADDFTGACDLAGRMLSFSESPISVYIDLAMTEKIEVQNQDFAIASISTRELDFTQGEKLVLQAEPFLKRTISKEKKGFYYKKIDSTLRGPFLAELKSWLELTDMKTIPLMPASPDTGRKLINGNYIVHGQQIYDTEFDRAKFWKGELIKIISDYSGLNACLFTLEMIRSADPCEYWRNLSKKHEIVLFEAEEISDVKRTVSMLIEENVTGLCGSSAPASFMPFEKTCAELYDISSKTSSPLRTLIICGSYNSVSREQLSHVSEAGANILVCEGSSLARQDYRESSENNSNVYAVATAAPDSSIPLTWEEKRQSGLSLAQKAYEIFEVFNPDRVIVTGGDTAEFFFRKLGINQLEVKSEWCPGIVSATSNQFHVEFIIKPGGFGNPGIMTHLSNLSK